MSKGHCINNSKYRKDSRRKACKAREEYRVTLTPVQQLKRLDERLGTSKGAVKERARLLALVSQSSQTKSNKNKS